MDWALVHDRLVGSNKVEREPNDLTNAAYKAIRYMSWQDVIKDAEYKYEAGCNLQDFFASSVDRCRKSNGKYRSVEDMHLLGFCAEVYEICIASIDWDAVCIDFSEE